MKFAVPNHVNDANTYYFLKREVSPAEHTWKQLTPRQKNLYLLLSLSEKSSEYKWKLVVSMMREYPNYGRPNYHDNDFREMVNRGIFDFEEDPDSMQKVLDGMYWTKQL